MAEHTLKSRLRTTGFLRNFSWQFLFTLRVFARNLLRGNRRNTLRIYLQKQGAKHRVSFGCVARSTVLLKPNVANILLFNFYEQKFVQHCPITIAIGCNDLSLLIFEEKWRNYASGPISAPNSDSFWVHRFFNACVRVFCAPNAIILLLYMPAKIKMSFIWKNDFFLPKSTSSVSRSQAHLFLPCSSVQPYSFGGRVKLNICQIKHELTFNEICTTWKKR